MYDQNPRSLLAQRLRSLREKRWSGRRITQPRLARALGVSVPLISSWESQRDPKIPPLDRLDSYAALFATARSFDENPGRVISPQDMTDEERQAMTELQQELGRLRRNAQRASAGMSELAQTDQISESLGTGPWRFEDTHVITIVCAQWPADKLEKIPYTQVDDPDYIELLTYSELDSLLELHGHLRAANPTNQVNVRIASGLTSDDYTSHLVTLGGIDWNDVTSSALNNLELPVRQIADWHTEGGQFFEVEGTGGVEHHRPVLDAVGGKQVLRQDVALFARALNPFNQKRTISICSGMFARGTYGAVRALTDARFRDRNSEYLRTRFGDSDSYCVLSRVPVVNGQTLTPDWTKDGYKLFEWSE